MNDQLHYLSLPNAPLLEADVLIFPVPYEQTVTYKSGTANGPRAILEASDQLEFFEEDAGWCPTDYMQVCVLPLFSLGVEEPVEAIHRRLYDYTASLPREVLFIALGGEHSITPEMVFARMPGGGTVVQIDAHADLRPTYLGSSYNHACPMHRIRQRDYQLLQIGIRSLHTKEAATIAADEGISTYFDRQLQRPGGWQKLHQHLASLTGPVWLSIDMDGFDPGLIAGVGTPQPGGLSWHEGVDVIATLMNNSAIDLLGVDILELVPEPTRVSDMVAAKLIQKCMSFWGKAKGYDQRPACGSQIGVADV